MIAKGLPAHEAWQQYVKHWDDIDREILLAFAMVLAGNSLPGRDPDAMIESNFRSRMSGGHVPEGEPVPGGMARDAEQDTESDALGDTLPGAGAAGRQGEEEANTGTAATQPAPAQESPAPESPAPPSPPPAKPGGNTADDSQIPVKPKAGKQPAKVSKEEWEEAKKRVSEMRFKPQPGDGEPVPLEQAFRDVKNGNAVHSGNHSYQKMIWNEWLHQEGEPPIAFKFSGKTQIDVEQLEPDQLQEFIEADKIANPGAYE
jgi:hypothetical protein